MRELQFKVPGIKKPLSFKSGGNEPKYQWIALINLIKSILYYLTITLLPVSIFLYSSSNYEQSSFNFILSMLIIISGFYIFELVINKKKKLIDPHSLLQVLIFALLVTTAAVLISPADKANTFGTLDSSKTGAFKGYAGISIILYILFYYFTIMINNKVWKQNLLLSLLSIGFTLSNFIWIVSDKPIDPFFVTIGLLIMIANILFVLKNNKLRALYSIGILFALINLIESFKGYTLNNIFFYSFIGLVPSIFTSFLVKVKFKYTFKNYFAAIKKDLIELKNNLGNYKKILEIKVSLLKKLFIALPLFLIIISVITYAAESTNVEMFKQFTGDLKDSFKLIDNTAKTILIGLGSSKGTEFQGVPGILLGQGLLGLTAYIFLGSYSIFISTKTILKTDSKEKRKIYTLLALFFINFFVICSSLFVYLSFIIIIIWWLLFSLFLTKINNEKVVIELDDKITKELNIEATKRSKTYIFNIGGKNVHLNVNKKVKIIFKYIFALTLLCSSFILVYVINKNFGSTL